MFSIFMLFLLRLYYTIINKKNHSFLNFFIHRKKLCIIICKIDEDAHGYTRGILPFGLIKELIIELYDIYLSNSFLEKTFV